MDMRLDDRGAIVGNKLYEWAFTEPTDCGPVSREAQESYEGFPSSQSNKGNLTSDHGFIYSGRSLWRITLSEDLMVGPHTEEC